MVEVVQFDDHVLQHQLVTGTDMYPGTGVGLTEPQRPGDDTAGFFPDRNDPVAEEEPLSGSWFGVGVDADVRHRRHDHELVARIDRHPLRVQGRPGRPA
jgi:hypothetical protein